jgi:ribonuclease P protein component
MRAAGRAESDLPRDPLLGLPRRERLRRRPEFLRVYERGIRAHGRYMVVFVMVRPDEQVDSRLGVTASRRVGGAVVRSRCKRRLRELFRLHRDELPGMVLDVVINARGECVGAPWEELKRDYRKCMKRLQQVLRPT